jgi:hypothetical protein
VVVSADDIQPAAVKDASRRVTRSPAAILDGHCARHSEQYVNRDGKSMQKGNMASYHMT